MEIERVRRSCSLLVERGFLEEAQVSSLVLAWKRLAREGSSSTSLPDVLVELGLVRTEQVGAVRSLCDSVVLPSHEPQVVAVEHLAVDRPADFARYEILEELSRGGMGVVFRARHKALGIEVALKAMLDPDPSSSARGRFEQEARVLAKLSHPNIVRVSDLGEEDGRLFYVMELVRGRNLEETYDREERLGVEWSVGIVRELAQALEFCHANGVVHRDVKPTNVIVEQERGLPVLVDFGLVHLGDTDRPKPNDEPLVLPVLRGRGEPPKNSFVTATGQVVGTPGFMAPEQISPAVGPIGPRADVYSLAATLYFLFTGHAPFDGNGVLEILAAVLRDDPRPVTSLNPRVPQAVAKVCHLALSRDPADRPASAALFAQALARALSGASSEEGAPLPERPSARLKPSFPRVVKGQGTSKRGGLEIKWEVVSIPKEASAQVETEPEPKGFRTLLKRGSRRFKKGDYAGAIALLSEAIGLFDRSAGAFSNRGAAHYMLRDYTEALADFDAALALDPDDVSIYRKRGRAQFKRRDFAAAVEEFTHVIRLAPNDPDGYHKRGIAYYRMGQGKLAADDESRARRLAWGPISGVDVDLEENSGELDVIAPVEPDPSAVEEAASLVTVLTLKGVLDASTTETLETLLHELLLQGHTRLLVNGDGLTHLGSRSATLFLGLLRPLRLAGGDLKFCQLSERALTVFSTLGLGELLQLEFTEQATALRAFDQPLPQAWLDALREGCVGLVTSTAYHRPTCEFVGSTDPAFQVWFESEDEAVLAGRRACPTCWS